jgi:hypothetical protein
MMTSRRYIRSDDKPFTFSHVQQAGTWSGFEPDETVAVTGEVFIGRSGNRAAKKAAMGGPKGMPNGQRQRLADEQAKARARFNAMPVVRDKALDNPVERTGKTMMVDKPKPHGHRPYDVYVRGSRAGTVKLRSYTGLK